MAARLACCLAAWMLSAPLIHAQQPLGWKLEPRRVFECERVVTQKQTVVLKGKTVTTSRQSNWLVRLEVLEQVATAARVQVTLSKVEHQVMPADDVLDAKLAGKMQGSSFVLTVTPTGEVTKLEGYEAFLKKLANGDKDKRRAVQAALPESALREAFAEMFGPMPAKAVSKGDTWHRDFAELIPHFGVLRSRASYTYLDDQIRYSIESEYELPKDDMSVLFRITKGRLTSEKGTGLITFDAPAGYLLQHDRKTSWQGSVTIDVMEKQHAMEFTSESELKIRIRALKR